jgi:uncharacterized protein YukJ
MADNQALLQLVALGLLSDNAHINLQVPAQAMEQVVKNVSFTEGVHLVFERFSHLPGYVFRQALDHLIEEKARTPEEFETLNSLLRENLKKFIGGDAVIGQMALADGLLIDNYTVVKPTERVVGIKRDVITGLEPARLLSAMLETGESDEKLKKYMFDRWWLRYRTNLSRDREGVNPVTDIFRIEDISTWYFPPSKERQLLGWANELPASDQYVPYADVADEVYRASDPMKYYALRKILTGENGVLGAQESRDKLLEGFIDSWINFGDNAQAEQTFRQALTSLFTTADQRELYHQLSPFLMDLILQQPREQYSYKDLAHERAGNEITRMIDQGILNPRKLRPKRTPESTRPDDQDFLARKIRRLITGGKTVEETAAQETTAEKLLSTFAGDSNARREQFTPLDAFFLLGENTGAVGTRTLQQIGLFKPDIAAGDRERFMDVYDKMKGQNRLQAYRTLVREAKHSPQIADLMSRTVEIRPRIGGGSLVTVYEFLLDDGSIEAVGVKNPNTEYHVENIVSLFDKTLTDVLTKDPGNRDFLLMKAILYDTQDWIMQELSDPRFEEKDTRFRELNDSRFGQFDSANNPYGILVPEHKETGTRWIRRDEFVAGKNLTALTISEATDIEAGLITQADYRSATSLIVLNSLHQLSTGLVHSDIHPGQFRITTDNANVAIFDRYNLLELDEAQQSLIGTFVESFASGSVDQAVGATVEYLFGLEKNQDILDTKDRVLGEVSSVLHAADSETASIDAIVALKQRGIYIPLEITLIAKNLLVMNRMAKEAGFNGIADAFIANYQ